MWSTSCILFNYAVSYKFFLGFETVASQNQIAIELEAKVNEYLSLIMRLIFAFGLSFQLPVVLSLLARVGLIDSIYLKKRRKYVIVIMFAFAALLTPPDPITQIGLALPLLLLYEISILTVKLIEKNKMHNIKDIRQNPNFYKDKLMERNYNLDLDGLIEFDKKNRELITKRILRTRKEKNF